MGCNASCQRDVKGTENTHSGRPWALDKLCHPVPSPVLSQCFQAWGPRVTWTLPEDGEAGGRGLGSVGSAPWGMWGWSRWPREGTAALPGPGARVPVADTVPSRRAEKLDEILAAAAEPTLRPDIAEADSRAATVRPRPTSRRITPAEISVSRWGPGSGFVRFLGRGPSRGRTPLSRGREGPTAPPGGTRGVAAPGILASGPPPQAGRVPQEDPAEAPAPMLPRGVSAPACFSRLAPLGAPPATPGPPRRATVGSGRVRCSPSPLAVPLLGGTIHAQGVWSRA